MNISKRFWLALVLVIGTVCLIGCTQQDVAPSSTTTTSPKTTAVSDKEPSSEPPSPEATPSDPAPAPSVSNFLADADALKNAQTQLEGLDKFEGKTVQVFQTPHFYEDGRIIIALQDPGKPDNVDEYTYQGGQWQEPVPVRLTGDGSIADNVTPLKSMPFTTIADMSKVWKEKAQTVEGAENKEMTHAYVNINPVTAKRRWFCDGIEGTRAEYQIFFNLDGTVETYEKR